MVDEVIGQCSDRWQYAMVRSKGRVLYQCAGERDGTDGKEYRINKGKALSKEEGMKGSRGKKR